MVNLRSRSIVFMLWKCFRTNFVVSVVNKPQIVVNLRTPFEISSPTWNGVYHKFTSLLSAIRFELITMLWTLQLAELVLPCLKTAPTTLVLSESKFDLKSKGFPSCNSTKSNQHRFFKLSWKRFCFWMYFIYLQILQSKILNTLLTQLFRLVLLRSIA